MLILFLFDDIFKGNYYNFYADSFFELINKLNFGTNVFTLQRWEKYTSSKNKFMRTNKFIKIYLQINVVLIHKKNVVLVYYYIIN